jgi:thioredoxin reductase
MFSCPIEILADGAENDALPRSHEGRYDVDMANETDGSRLPRREWMQATAALGATMALAGCSPVHRAVETAMESRRRDNMLYDVVIVGGGPAGLSAALALGRARKRVLLCDSGPRRNAPADHIHNFVTRDGSPPDEFRQVARAQLDNYPNVRADDLRVESVSGTRGAFRLALASGTIEARRILLCTGMIDELPPIEGFRELWGSAIFQCPYCHGWEVQDRPWGYLADSASVSHLLPFALQARGWTRDLVVLTNGAFEVPDGVHSQLQTAGIRLETARVAGLVSHAGHLAAIELSNGDRVRCEALFAHPAQRQVKLVESLGVTLDDDGFARVDPMRLETSVPGIYAAGDLTTRMQGAMFAAAAGTRAGAMINLELTMELVSTGAL